MLGPIETNWAKQLDKECLQKRMKKYKQRKMSAFKKEKRELELECIENAIAKQHGYKYSYGITFDESNMPEVLEPRDPVAKAGVTVVLAGIGVPGVPPDMPFCNSCQTHGHSHITSMAAKNIILHN